MSAETDKSIASPDKCAPGLDWRAQKAHGKYMPYFEDRAAQCRKWAADLTEEGLAVDLARIAGALREFEAIAL
jgi:hypothetical protein